MKSPCTETRRGRAALFAVCAGLMLSASSHAQHTQPYAGQDARSIKALSDEEIKQYLAGAGLGYARPAELNHYPGPMHVLELQDKLHLTAEQRSRTAQLMDGHKAEARELGRKYVEAEQALDALFRSGRMDDAQLAGRVRAVSITQGEYRLSHLETHRRMREILTADQIRTYDRLRGYSGGSQHTPDRKH